MIGRRLLHYEIRESLDKGAMGEVYRARDGRLRREVALKLLTESSDPDRDRLREEARMLANLRHPGIVTVHAFEEDEGTFFLVMELVDGRRLDRHIPREGLPESTAASLGVQIADALAAAHGRGVLHRDLKTSNIMVEARGRTKILDFGLARPLSEDWQSGLGEGSLAASAVTARSAVAEQAKTPGSPAGSEPRGSSRGSGDSSSRPSDPSSRLEGTLAYLAPELLMGEPAGIGTEIYAFGVVLYEMLTGRRPFRGAGAAELLNAVVHDQPIPVRRLAPDVCEPFAELVETCLAKDARDRPPSMRAVRDRLKEIEERSTLGTARLFLRDLAYGRSRWWMPAILGLAVSVLVLAAVPTLRDGLPLFRGATSETAPEASAPGPASLRATAADSRQRILVLPFQNLGRVEDTFFADGLTEEITSRLSAVRDLAVISRTSALEASRLGGSLQEIARRLDVDFVLEGTVRWDRTEDGIGRVRVTPQLVRVADDTHLWGERYDDVIEDIFAVQERIALAVTAELDITLFPAERRSLADRPTESMEAYRAFLRARAYIDRPEGLADQEDAIVWLRRATELDPEFAEAWAELALVHSQLHHFGLDRSENRRQLAATAIERALELAPHSPEVRLARGHYLYWVLRDYAAARRELAVAARDLPNSVRLFEVQSYLSRRTGDFIGSIEWGEKARELDPLAARLERTQGVSHYFLGRFDEAERHLSRAHELAADQAMITCLRIHLYWLMGDLDRAQEAVAELPSRGDPLGLWYRIWNRVYHGDTQAALELLRASDIEIFRWTVRIHPRALIEAEILGLEGQADAARRAYGEALTVLDAEAELAPDDPRIHGARGMALAGLVSTAAGIDTAPVRIAGSPEEWAEEAVAAGERAARSLPLGKDAMNGPYRLLELARIHTRLGQHRQAVGYLSRLLSVPSEYSPALLELDPRWRPLHGEPGYGELLAMPVRRDR